MNTTLKRQMSLLRFKQKATPWLFLTPAIIVLVFVLFIPIVNVIYYSFSENMINTENPKFIGFSNYIEVFQYDGLWQMLSFTVLFTAGSVILHILLGLILAVALNTKINKTVLAIFRVIFLLPWVFTAAVVAIVWQLMMTPQGIINSVLSIFSENQVVIDWLGDPKIVVISLLIINAWRGYPHCMISILSGLQNIPTSIYEAADVDGASTARKFFSITLPQLKPVLLSVSLLDAIFTMNLFPLIWLTTGGGPLGQTETIATLTYRFSFVRFEFGLASALAVIGLIITFTFTIFYMKLQKSVDD